jgi:FeS assembly SUF system protein
MSKNRPEIPKHILESAIVEQLKLVYDPEIPVNIYDLGLIYDIDVADDGKAKVLMTLTAPNCPVADTLPEEVRVRAESVAGITSVEVELTFDPPWRQDHMSEEAKLMLGLL